MMKTKKQKKVIKKDISEVGNAELGQFVWDNHGPFFQGNMKAFLISSILASVYYSQKYGYAFPSEATLAENLGVHKRTVQRYIAEIAEAVDETGQPLWTIVSAKDNGGFGRGNHYIPNFVYRAADSKLNEQIQEYYANGSKDEVHEAEEGFEEPELRSSDENTEQHIDYEFASLPSTVARDPQAMFEFMIPHGMRSFQEPDNFKQLNASQQDFISILLSYLAINEHIREDQVNKVAKVATDTWTKHSETPREIFYNRFVSYLLAQAE